MTTRRGFLQSIAAAIAAASVPLVASAAPIKVTNAGGTFEFIGPQYFDWGRQVALAIKLPNGKMHAARKHCHYKRAIVQQDITDLKAALLDWAEAQYRKAA